MSKPLGKGVLDVSKAVSTAWSKGLRLTAQATASALVFALFHRLGQEEGVSALAGASTLAYLLLGVVAVVVLHGLATGRPLLRKPRRSALMAPAKAPTDADKSDDFAYVVAPVDHAYYDKIDRARQRFLSGRPDGTSAIKAEREERIRARFRSHDPRRWRIQPARFGTPDADFDFPLFDWAVAEKEMRALERKAGLDIQRPPLAYNDAAAKNGATEAGHDYYFSIADFEAALLHGSFELKSTSSATKILIQLSDKGERSPNSVMISELDSTAFGSAIAPKECGARRRQSRASHSGGGDSSD